MIAAGLRAAPVVPGRFEPVRAGQPFDVIVDFAHTPDGLRAALAAARPAGFAGDVIVVFGAGGDRDRAKRPEMGAVAVALAERSWSRRTTRARRIRWRSSVPSSTGSTRGLP